MATYLDRAWGRRSSASASLGDEWRRSARIWLGRAGATAAFGVAAGAFASKAPPILVAGALAGAVLVWFAAAALGPALGLVLYLLPMLPKELGPSLLEGELLLSAGRVLLLVFASAWLLRRFVHGEPRLAPTPLAGILLVAALLSLPSVIGSSNVRTSALSFVSLNVEYYLVFFLVASAIAAHGLGHAHRLAAVLVLSGVTLGAISVFEAVTHVRVLALLPLAGGGGSYDQGQLRFGLLRVQATLPHSIFLGAVQAMLLPVAVHLAFEARRAGWRLAALGAAGVIGVSLVLTVSRGAWLAAGVGVGLQVLLSSRRKARYLWVPYVAVLGLIALVLFAPAILDIFTRLWSALFDRQSSAEESLAITYRLALLHAAIDAVQRQPWTGHGLNTFLTAGLTGTGSTGLVSIDSADNYYLMALVEGGIPGLLGFLLIVGGVLVHGWRALRRNTNQASYGLCAALFGAIVGFALLNVTVGAYRVPQVSYTFWALAGLLLGLGARAARTEHAA